MLGPLENLPNYVDWRSQTTAARVKQFQNNPFKVVSNFLVNRRGQFARQRPWWTIGLIVMGIVVGSVLTTIPAIIVASSLIAAGIAPHLPVSNEPYGPQLLEDNDDPNDPTRPLPLNDGDRGPNPSETRAARDRRMAYAGHGQTIPYRGERERAANPELDDVDFSTPIRPEDLGYPQPNYGRNYAEAQRAEDAGVIMDSNPGDFAPEGGSGGDISF